MMPLEKSLSMFATEGAMPGLEANPPYPMVDFVLGAIAGWIKRHRSLRGVRDELRECSPDEAMKIAKDLRMPLGDFYGMTAKAPDAANDVSKMLRALSLDPSILARTDPATMRDLHRTCALCIQKGRCRHEFAKDTAARHFREFCPNAYTLDARLSQS
jgi:hypothetical protein